jgi:ABC-type transport system involved in Fe-S cluster assembly fused permease/ATPase subunit
MTNFILFVLAVTLLVTFPICVGINYMILINGYSLSFGFLVIFLNSTISFIMTTIACQIGDKLFLRKS